MAKIVCVLKSGGEFKPEHVQALKNGAARHNPQIPFFCLSDTEVLGVNTIPLINDWPGWWSKIELFNQFRHESILYFDLDSVILGDVSALFKTELTLLQDVYKPEKFGSGVMSWAGDYSYLYDIFIQNPDKYIAEYKTADKWGDQGFIMNHARQPIKAFDFGPLHSYKVHCKNGVPSGTNLVYFHGKPRPWETDLYRP